MIQTRLRICLFTLLLLLWATATRALAADVVIVGDTRLKPVLEIVSGVRSSLDASIKVFTPSEVKGRLAAVVRDEEAKVVVALGREAIAAAMALPSVIPVIYDLVVTPLEISRPNTTGCYMATPVREYGDLIRNYLHSIKRVAVVGNRDQLKVLAKGESRQMESYSVKSPVEFVNTVKRLDTADAILLLPDVSLLTNAALEEAYLLSFRKHIPLLGISERHVKEGALLALVVDPVTVGKQIGEYAAKAIRGANIGQIPPSPPRKFELYLNTGTARKMGIHIPEEVVRMAKRVYQ